ITAPPLASDPRAQLLLGAVVSRVAAGLGPIVWEQSHRTGRALRTVRRRGHPTIIAGLERPFDRLESHSGEEAPRRHQSNDAVAWRTRNRQPSTMDEGHRE